MSTLPAFDPVGMPPAPELTWTDLGDALWLAAVVGAGGISSGLAGDELPESPPTSDGEDARRGEDDPTGPSGPPEPPSSEILAPTPAGLTEVPRPARPRPPTGVPVLPGGRDIARALRPLKRLVLSGTEQEADEEATAERAAEDGLWLPQTRPTPSRWLSVLLIVDESPSMAVWEPTVVAFRTLLEHHGAFRDVREFRLLPAHDNAADVRIRGPGTGPRDPAELVDPTGRQLKLIVTDGLDSGWRSRRMARLLHRWGTTGPTALVQPYPQSGWARGHLTPHPVRLRAPRPAAPNAQLILDIPAEFQDPFGPPLSIRGGAVAVPVLELSSRWLWWWANLVANPPAAFLDAMVVIADPDRGADLPYPLAGEQLDSITPEVSDLDPAEAARDRVLRFRATASPLAFRLATYFAAAPLELPFLRTLQGIVLPESLPVHLAEVLTSDLVRKDPGGRAQSWDFANGVREMLLAAATREESARVIRAVSEHYGGHDGVAALTNVLTAPDLVPDTPVTPDTLPLVRVELAVLRALSGPYAGRARRLSESIEAFGEPRAPDPGLSNADLEMGENMVAPAPDDDRRSTEDMSWTPAEPDFDLLDEDLLLDEPIGAARPVVWGNVPPRNQFFTGRQELLERMEQRLRTGKVTAVLPQALHGMGGVGKSQVAIEYAYRHRTEFDVVWWIPSEQLAQVLSALIDLGQRLGLDVGPEANTAVPAVLEALRAGVPYDNWLLVFDNAENLEAVREYLPESGAGRVLVTSRNPDWGRVAETLEVDVFTRQESIGLLRRRDPDVTEADADALADALGDLPLAVEQASTWRATTGMPVQNYLRLLREKRAELLELAPAPGYEMPVAAAWNVALDRLGVENPAALQLLQVLSFFAPEPINRDLLTGPRNGPITPELDEALQNPSKLGKAIRDIQRYGLARVDHRTSTVQLHRLVNVVLWAQMTPQQRLGMEHGSHVLLAGGNPGSPDNPRQWHRYQELVPHVVRSNALTCADAWARELVLDIVEFHYSWGDLTGCRDLSQQVVDQWRGQIGPDDQQTLRAAKWLGYVSTMLGALPQAAEINADCLERLERSLGPDDEETLDAMMLVALDRRAAGDFGEALRLDEEALRRSRGALGEDEPTTLRSAHNLAISLRLAGEFRRALALDTQTYRRRVAVYGDQHPLTLMTFNGFTLDQRECGAYRKAHASQEKVYEMLQAVVGPNHLNALLAARNLAVARRRAGLHDSARKLAEDTRNRNRQRFGPTHHETIAATLNLAVDLRVAGELDQARALAERTLEDYHHSLGPAHPYALYARTNLAIVLRLSRETEAALREDTQAHENLTARLGADHVITITCAINLASDYADLGDHQQAYTLDAATLVRSRDVLGSGHPTTLACEANLALDLEALGRHAEAQGQHDAVLAKFIRVLGRAHPASVGAAQKQRANCDADPMPL
jgi:hypothetical protein